MNLKTLLALRKNYGQVRNTKNIKYIVIHYTANDGDSDEGNSSFFHGNYRGASAHYFVDDDSATQSVPDNCVAYSVGGAKYSDCKTTGGGSLYKICTNSNSLNIEMCDTVKDGRHDVTEATLSNTVSLVKNLMSLYNIDINHVVRHFDVTGKHCPEYYMDNTAWQGFKNRLSTPAAPVTPATPVAPASAPATNKYVIKKWTVCTVKLGSTGEEVRFLQQLLTAAGYPTDCSGVFTTVTKTALVNYQNKNGLSSDGICGKGTWTKILAKY